uniref:Uncharacterized protein n=1 Tax=Leersia perrieri TaxID=77586 RepID=A0A0D9XVG1_9ORYZ
MNNLHGENPEKLFKEAVSGRHEEIQCPPRVWEIKIGRKRLTGRWIAEGFVREKQGLSVEEVPEACFNHLVRRKIIRPVEYSSNGKVKNCQVHDMVLEHITFKASEENFVSVVGGHWLMPPPNSKVRRLSLQSRYSKRDNAMDSMNISHVRSLTMFGSLNLLPSNSFKFGVVQVLDLQGCKGFKQQHVKEICKMVLIKYLSLRRTDIKTLPKNMESYKTLDVRETSVTKLPTSVCQLERLVNILGGDKRTRKALKFPYELKKSMNTLQILSGIEIGGVSTAAADFQHLTDLRKLAIYKLNVKRSANLSKDLRSSVEYLGGYSLHNLVIGEDDSSEFPETLNCLSPPPLFLTSLQLYGKLVALPGWITQMDCLTKLALPVTILKTENLECLRRLPSLFSLTFSHPEAKLSPQPSTTMEENRTNPSEDILAPAGGFNKLKLLRIFTPTLSSLRLPEEAMPNLERIELRFNTMEGLSGIQNLKFLKEVHLRVHYTGSVLTMSIVENIAAAAKRQDKGPRIIVEKYYA